MFKFEKNLDSFELDYLEYHRIRLINLLKLLKSMVKKKLKS
jgi:hypothetical protein